MESSKAGRKDPERADPITRLIARRVAELRKERGMSGAKLSAAVRELGLRSWVDSTVGKLETLRRESVTVTELFALATALGVPPLLLLTDVTKDEPIPIAGGREMAPWEAIMWMLGRSPDEGWAPAAEPLELGLEVESIIDSLRESRQIDAVVRMSNSPKAAERLALGEAADRESLAMLAFVLPQFERRGLSAPTLPQFVVERAKELGVELPGLPVIPEST